MAAAPKPVLAATKVVYSCADGTSLNATFDTSADTVTLELGGGVLIVLNPAVSGSGFRYTGGGYELLGKAGNVTLVRPGQGDATCSEIGRVDLGPTAPAPAPPPAQAANPSFSCGGRLNATEQRICNNATLADLDRRMADTYSWLLGQMRGSGERQTLKNDQRGWLAKRNACGSNDGCIESELLDRTAYLNEYLEPGTPPAPPPPAAPGVAFPFPAQSWGGIVRSGPGMNYRRQASLREGERITLLENSGVHMNGYDWFKIRYRGRTGYQWGGIICPRGQAVSGTFQVCN